MSFRLAWLAPAALVAVSWLASSIAARDSAQAGGDAATCVKIEGALLEKTKEGFKPLKVGDRVPTETLLVGLPQAELTVKDAKVHISLLLYLGEKLPITEAAVMLHDSPQHAADITVDRGVIALKAKADTIVRIRGGRQKWELSFKDPDNLVLVARFARHEPGTKLFAGVKRSDEDEPLQHFGVLVVKGRVAVNTGNESYALHAPPGPAQLGWDSTAGSEVKQLESLPDEVKNLQPADPKLFQQACEITGKLAAGDIGKNLDELVASDVPLKRRVAVASMSALDDLPRLWGALGNTKHRDVRDQAVHNLRHWIGRHPGQLAKLKDHLVKSKNLSPIEARTIAQLLKGFDERDRHEPVVFQLLIGGLENPSLPIRELSYWNLERLAPAGQKISYDAAADEPARRRAVEQWRQLIPEGQLPPSPKDEVKKGM
jgi:hypothetical protein